MGEAGRAIFGAGTTKTLNEAPRLAAQYGGKEADWAKMTSSSYRAKDGSKVHALVPEYEDGSTR
jgi:filamentous hemagglutinin